MISIFPSEPVGPQQGPSNRSPNTTPESQDPSDRASFSDFVKRDEARAPDRDAPPPQEVSQTPTQTETRRDLILSFEGAGSDPALPQGDPAIAEAEIDTLRVEPVDVAAASLEAADSRKLTQADLAAPVLETAPRDAKAAMPGRAAETAAQAEIDPARTAETARPSAEADVQAKPRSDLAAPVDLKKEAAPKTEPEAATDLKLATASEREAGETLRIQRGEESPEPPRADFKDLANAKSAETASTADKLILGAEKSTQLQAGREAPIVIGDTVLTVGQSQAAQSQVTTPGLAPTAPSVQVAAPNEITSIILNNLRSGVDPQEQLIIQLDPPELGRVSIDFKFDAQGVQQITVTTEHPEALKRLRELHFELTEALKDRGLSDTNMSFKQESGNQSSSQSSSPWQLSDRGLGGAGANALEAPLKAASLAPNRAAPNTTNRLDITL